MTDTPFGFYLIGLLSCAILIASGAIILFGTNLISRTPITKEVEDLTVWIVGQESTISGRRLRMTLEEHDVRISTARFYSLMAKLIDQKRIVSDVMETEIDGFYVSTRMYRVNV